MLQILTRRYFSTMIYLIRHAQSKYNIGQKLLKDEFQALPENADKSYLESQKYLKMKFDMELEDVDITEQGVKQCQQAAENLIRNNIGIDLVIVSPFRRALSTCAQIFKIYKMKTHNKDNLRIIVDPDFREILQSVCDIGSKLRESMKDYPDFDYTLIQNPDYWYMESLVDKQMRDKLIKKVIFHEPHEFGTVAKNVMNDFLKEIWQKRCENQEANRELKSKMLSSVEIQKKKLQILLSKQQYKGKNIAIVTHSQNIKSYIGQKPPNCSIFEYRPQYFDLKVDNDFPKTFIN